MMQKFHELIEFTYYKEEEDTEQWAEQMNKMKRKGFEVKDIGNVGITGLQKYVIFEKYYGGIK
jgi:hypothetical protein